MYAIRYDIWYSSKCSLNPNNKGSSIVAVTYGTIPARIELFQHALVDCVCVCDSSDGWWTERKAPCQTD